MSYSFDFEGKNADFEDALKKEFKKIFSEISTMPKLNVNTEKLQSLVTLCNRGYKYDNWHDNGGEALVVRVKNIYLDNRVEILKIPHEHMTNSERKKQRFFRGSALQSPLKKFIPFGVPEIYACSYDPSWISMEYIHGILLLDYAMSEKITEDDIVRKIGKLAYKMSIFHECAVIHRDIKPENIKISFNVNSQNYEPVILDYGLAKKMEDASKNLTILDTQMGSIPFAPEEMMGDNANARDADYQSDIYQLGVTFYTCLVCKKFGIEHKPFDYDQVDISLIDAKYQEILENSIAVKELRYKNIKQFLTKLSEISGVSEEEFEVEKKAKTDNGVTKKFRVTKDIEVIEEDDFSKDSDIDLELMLELGKIDKTTYYLLKAIKDFGGKQK